MNSLSRKCRGFTLIEVLVAFIVLSMSLGVIMNILSLSMRTSRVANNHQHALLLAESKMAELVAEHELRVGRYDGQFEEPFEWNAEIESWEFPDQELGTVYTLTSYRVQITVSWGERNPQRLSLSTIHLVSESEL